MLHRHKSLAFLLYQPFKTLHRLSTPYILLLLVIICSMMGLAWFNQKFSLLPIHYVRIVGSYSTELNATLKKEIEPLIAAQGSQVNLQMIVNQLKQWSCIEHITLWRILPYTLIIRLSIREPVAIFQTDETTTHESTQWVDRTGFLFEASPQKSMTHLPKLIGSRGQSKHLLQHYQALNALLKPHAIQITRVALDTENRCSIKLTNGIQLLLGHLDPCRQLQQLLDLNASVLQQKDKISVLDLRYPNGMAVTWRESTL